MKIFILYGTSACHLCEIAHDMVLKQQAEIGGITVEEVDISETDALFECYGIRIPVLLHPDQRELGWPFSAAQLRAFLQS